jgi:general secretion pathway protein D
MRIVLGTVLTLIVAAALGAQESPTAPALNSLATPQASSSPAPSAAGAQNDAQPLSQPTTESSQTAIASLPPPPSAHDVSEAKKQFSAGMKLKSSGKIEAAFEKFEQASQSNPRSVDYVTAREFTRQQLVMQALDRGNKAMQAKNEVVATAEFRRALEYDPTNEFARQRLNDSVWEGDAPPGRSLQVVQKSVEVFLSPSPERKDFHFRGDSRTLLTQIAKAYGITAMIDDSVQTRRVRYDIESVNFATAMETATRVTRTFWIALSGSQMYLVADTTENRRNFERLAIRTFYLPDTSTPQELADMANALRTILEIRFVVQNAAESTISIRAPLPFVEAAGKLIESLAGGRPQVTLDVRVYQISSSLVRQLGTTWPTQFTLFNISPGLVASFVASLGAGGQDLINQLIASGGINQANSQAVQALLAQLQQASTSPLISLQPFATFGGGQTLMGLSASPPGITTHLNLNESDVRGLSHVTLRASQNTPAILKIGERYPIVNASFAPIYNSSAISQVLGNRSYVAPFPSFNFEDLGLNLKATPIIHSNSDVSLKVELNIRSLGTQTVNGIPVVLNREYIGSITLKNEESGVVAGLISKADSRSLSGYPFLSRVPDVTYAASQHDKNVSDDELLIVMTPHIVRMASSQPFAVQLPVGH